MHDNKKITILAAVALVLAAIATVTLATRDRHHEEAVAQAPVTKKPVKKAIAKAVQKAKTDTTDTVKTDTLVEGYITDTDGKGISRVVVSDGYQCVLTDTTGHYQFMRHAKARFVFYSVPEDCAIPTHSATDRTALFYQPLSKTRSVYNFRPRRLPWARRRATDSLSLATHRSPTPSVRTTPDPMTTR